MGMKTSSFGDGVGNSYIYGSVSNLLFTQTAESIQPSFCLKIGYYHSTQNLEFDKNKNKNLGFG